VISERTKDRFLILALHIVIAALVIINMAP
jgi:hypothetical protein